MAKKSETLSAPADINVEPYKKDAVSLFNLASELVVKDEESELMCAELVSRVEVKRKEIKGTHDSLTKPLKDHVKFINRMFDPIEDKLEEISASLRRKNVDYFKVKEAKAEEKRLKEMEAFNKKAVKAIEAGKEMPDFNSKVVEPEKTVVTSSGTLSMQKFWNFEITDAFLVPRTFCEVNESLIRKAILDGAREIEGVRIFEDVRSVNRR